ncbi:hypothetical protein RD110_01600 [Rhodoferax koreense]|uniref:Uncharacterized protein n=1 Tax=Rhodoferax koreensis TaxID=1842727 RepID=A0A1P8JQQ7_9BURK|nr:LysR substrate-binding domain-containing protein [Rhodoferax koreense]APW36061.1 hypothetical protein RD110_01600 [Rhodoferax koreense]
MRRHQQPPGPQPSPGTSPTTSPRSIHTGWSWLGNGWKRGAHAEVMQEASRTITVLAWVAAHCGVALVSSATARVVFPGVDYREIREGHLLPTMELSAVWAARSRPTLADRFVGLLPQAG